MPKIPTRWLPWHRRIDSARVWREAQSRAAADREAVRWAVSRTQEQEYQAAKRRLIEQARRP